MTYFQVLNTSDTADMQTLFAAANRISSGLLMPVILLVIAFTFILGFTFSGKSVSRSVLYTCFVCSVLSMLMVLMNWLALQYMYFIFFLTAVSVIWVWFAESFS